MKKTKKFLSVFLACTTLLGTSLTAFAKPVTNDATYFVNKNGETYGTDAQAALVGYEADLILAVGENNTVGYVRATDLDNGVKNPTEATKSNHTSSVTYVPLYSSDGKTVIGKFAVAVELQESNSSRAVVEYLYGASSSVISNNYTCTVRSAIADCTNGVRGLTRVHSSKMVATGYLGVQVRIYRSSDDALVDSSAYKYNIGEASLVEYTSYHATVKTNESYYSKGCVKLYNENKKIYKTVYTEKSPSVKPTIINP